MSTSNVSTNYGFTLTDKGIILKDAADIYTAIMELFQTAFSLQNKQLNTSKYTPQGQLATSLAAIVNNKNIDLLTLANNLDINKSTGIWLDMVCKLYGIIRKQAEPTIVACTCTGLPGVTITKNVSQAADTAGNIYVASETVTIPESGSIVVSFKNTVPGAIGCVQGTLNTIVTTTAGWDTIINNVDGAVGSNTETDPELRTRYKELVSSNATGTLAALKGGILALNGVLDVAAAENVTDKDFNVGGWTIKPNQYSVSVLGGDNTEIAEQIYLKKSAALMSGNTEISFTHSDIGQEYKFNIVRPTELSFKFKIVLANQSSLPLNIETSIKEAVFNNFYGLSEGSERVHIGSTTYASRFYTSVNSVLDGIDVSSITMASQPAGGAVSAYDTKIVCGFAQYPSLALEDIDVSFSE